MLTRLEIEGYKLFRHLEIGPIGQLLAIGGRNNVGKTSLLEAVFMFFDRTKPDLLLRSLAWRGFGAMAGSAEQVFSHAFHNFDVSRDIVIRATLDDKSYSLRLVFKPSAQAPSVPIATVHERSSSSSEPEYSEKGGDGGGTIEVTLSDDEHVLQSGEIVVEEGSLKLLGNITRAGLPVVRYQGLRIRSTPEEDAQRLGALKIKGQSKHLVEFAGRFFPEITSLDAIPAAQGPMIYADVGLPKQIPLPALGDGPARLISFYLSASTVRDGGILLLDEVGSGFHHSLLPSLWEGLSEISRHFDCQIIATSHSYECLSAAARGPDLLYDEQFVYARLESDHSSGEVRAICYNISEFRAAIENEWEFR